MRCQHGQAAVLRTQGCSLLPEAHLFTSLKKYKEKSALLFQTKFQWCRRGEIPNCAPMVAESSFVLAIFSFMLASCCSSHHLLSSRPATWAAARAAATGEPSLCPWKISVSPKLNYLGVGGNLIILLPAV